MDKSAHSRAIAFYSLARREHGWPALVCLGPVLASTPAPALFRIEANAERVFSGGVRECDHAEGPQIILMMALSLLRRRGRLSRQSLCDHARRTSQPSFKRVAVATTASIFSPSVIASTLPPHASR